MLITAINKTLIDQKTLKLHPEPCLFLVFCPEEDGSQSNVAAGKQLLKVSSKDGYLNLRDGPGTGHTLISSMPAGSIVRQVGRCVKGDDNVTRFKWCNVEWNGSTGWASAYGLELAEAKPE
jgi:hypothetical protein